MRSVDRKNEQIIAYLSRCMTDKIKGGLTILHNTVECAAHAHMPFNIRQWNKKKNRYIDLLFRFLNSNFIFVNVSIHTDF